MRYFSLLLAAAISLSVVAQTDSFAFNFFEAMQGLNDQNVLVSPLSIKQAVGMAANGAQNQTITEILSLSDDESLGALNLRNEEERTLALNKLGNTYGTILKVANSAWHSPLTPFSAAFRDSRLPDPLFMGRVNFINGEACEAPVAKVFSGLDNLSLQKAEKKMINGHVVIRKKGMDYNVLGQQM